MSTDGLDNPTTELKAFITANLADHCGLDIHGVYEIDTLEGFDIREACRSHGLEIEEVKGFESEDEADAVRYQQSEILHAGVTILVKIGGLLKPVIFIKREMSNYASLNEYVRYGITLHELGHADDMIRGINYQDGKSISLDKAEAYAEVFCLRRLNGNKDPVSEMTRNLFAKRLCNMNGKDPLKRRVYEEAMTMMSRGKVATWASKSIPGVELT
ncbi:hypothetical protein AEQ67_09815 [Pseudomonas sp. RIT-PI-q]|uniref:hypothetical protein n=1 Tax=Pseudomonas sp. RIT-PI-q TaxID=1690247 RepID=UPI0006CCD913|nr:hypothetical protein [Pseudomonas sp. RIT-PI-q]KPG99425.1 hypothetical protein AEQ67_09815 [Pseudomonas sp. RIT-PI-q]